MRIHFIVASIFLLLLATACPKSPKLETGTCKGSKDCGGPTAAKAHCLGGHCVACRGDTDCDVDQTCIEGRCEAAAACACGELESCIAGTCVAMECVGSYDCPFGALCDDGVCVPAHEVADPPIVELASESVELPEGCATVSSGGALDLSSIQFELNEADLSDEAQELLALAAECLIATDDTTIRVEGHADDRGTLEYNLGLGDRRARAVATFLYHLGVSGERLVVVSKGEEEPVCLDASEDCWSLNRRVELFSTLPLEGTEHAER